MTSEAVMNDHYNPCILECGYEEVWIEKSGRTFPAWKVALETGTWWRSKLDFLLLSRHAAIPLPKAAFHKLVQESPWQRPNTQQVERNINHWKAQMKKNLHVMDHYLCTVQRNHPQAWNQFSRPSHTENLLSNQDTLIDHQRSKQWGQYFSSDDNAKKVVQVLMENCDTTSIDWIIEPSCGHGTILQALVETGRKQQSGWNKLLGIDIDPKAISYCQEQHSTDPAMKHIQFEVADFLTTRRSDFGIEKNEHCVIVGNPPFHRAREFVEHAIAEYEAKIVVFIMPKRCCDKNDGICEYNTDYEYKTIPMDSCDFHFQGNRGQSIRQPSSIQLFYLR